MGYKNLHVSEEFWKKNSFELKYFGRYNFDSLCEMFFFLSNIAYYDFIYHSHYLLDAYCQVGYMWQEGPVATGQEILGNPRQLIWSIRNYDFFYTAGITWDIDRKTIGSSAVCEVDLD